MAVQARPIDGAEGYALLADDDRNATNPGDTLRLLFNRYAPCLLLVDEWVAYARQLHERADLPGGSFDTVRPPDPGAPWTLTV